MGKNSTLPAFLLSKLINEQDGIFCLLHEKLQAGWKENLKNLSEHALLLGSSEYMKKVEIAVCKWISFDISTFVSVEETPYGQIW